MWPWEHLASGYVLYSALTHLSGRTPGDYPTLALVLGTQFPDLVDKPLAWSLGLLPAGRSLAHSLITFVLLVGLLHAVCRHWGHDELSIAFGIGYLTHLLGDALAPALAGDYYYLGFLGWPLISAIDYGEESFAANLPSIDALAFSTVEVALAALIVGLWLIDGSPGLRPIFALPRRTYRWLSTTR